MPAKIKYEQFEKEMFADAYIESGYVATVAFRKVFPRVANTLRNDIIKYRACALRDECAELINQKRKEIYDSLCIDAMRVTSELADIAFAQKEDDTYTTQYKIKALELLGKSVGIFDKKEDKQEQRIHVTITDDGINNP